MTERLRGLVEEFNRWRRFWWRAIKNGMKPGASLVNWVLALVTLVGLLFSVQLTVRRAGDDLVTPLVILGMFVLVFFCHGAFLTWKNEVENPTEVNAALMRQVTGQAESARLTGGLVGAWRATAELRELIHDQRVNDALDAAAAVANTGLPRPVPSVHLQGWSLAVEHVLQRSGRSDLIERFRSAGQTDGPPTDEWVRDAYEARLALIRSWSKEGSELFPKIPGEPD